VEARRLVLETQFDALGKEGEELKKEVEELRAAKEQLETSEGNLSSQVADLKLHLEESEDKVGRLEAEGSKFEHVRSRI